MTDYLLTDEERHDALMDLSARVTEMGEDIRWNKVSEVIAEAQHKKTIKWLDEPDTEHPIKDSVDNKQFVPFSLFGCYFNKHWYYKKRIECPECRKNGMEE